MLTLVTLVALLSGALGFEWAAQWLIDEAERRRLGRVARHRGRSWTVTIGLGPQQLALAGRLTEIARQALGQGGQSVEVVFVPRPEYPVSHHHGFLRAA